MRRSRWKRLLESRNGCAEDYDAQVRRLDVTGDVDAFRHYFKKVFVCQAACLYQVAVREGASRHQREILMAPINPRLNDGGSRLR